MYCPKCGTKIEDHQRYCPSCGELIDADTQRDNRSEGNDRLAPGVVRGVGIVSEFLKNNCFRLAVAIIMMTISIILIKTFIIEFMTTFSCLSGLEKERAAICSVIYVLAAFIPVLLSLESIRKSIFITAKLDPREFNIRKYAIKKGALLPIAIDLTACLMLGITPIILYNYKENEMLSSLIIILSKYKTSAVICCLLCAISFILVIVSRKRITHEKAYIN